MYFPWLSISDFYCFYIRSHTDLVTSSVVLWIVYEGNKTCLCLVFTCCCKHQAPPPVVLSGQADTTVNHPTHLFFAEDQMLFLRLQHHLHVCVKFQTILYNNFKLKIKLSGASSKSYRTIYTQCSVCFTAALFFQQEVSTLHTHTHTQ